MSAASLVFIFEFLSENFYQKKFNFDKTSFDCEKYSKYDLINMCKQFGTYNWKQYIRNDFVTYKFEYERIIITCKFEQESKLKFELNILS